MRLERKLSSILPPNMETDRVQGWILWSLTVPAFVCAILFLVRYYQAYDQLWWSAYTPWPGELRALMAPFAQCAVWTLLVYPVLAVVALATAAVLYSSYYQGSRSIYLMRRLPDGRSLLRRQVWTVPLLWAVCAAALALSKPVRAMPEAVWSAGAVAFWGLAPILAQVVVGIKKVKKKAKKGLTNAGDFGNIAERSREGSESYVRLEQNRRKDEKSS